MMHYKDRTFCRGDGCTKFNKCPIALTPEVIQEANRWWGKAHAPIAQVSDPKTMECYEGPDVKSLLLG